MRLLNLDESLHEFIVRGDLSAGHAKVILSLKDKEDQRKVADEIMAKDMSVRQAEEYVRRYIENQENPKVTKTKQDIDPRVKQSTREVETKLKKHLGSKVRIKLADAKLGKGKIVIDYNDYEDLDRLIEILGE